MSKFSGRYDFYDYLHAHKFTDEDIKNNLYIYIGKTKTPLEINNKKDLIQYYAYVPKKDKIDLDVYKELIKRVKMDYKKADIKGLHLIKFKYLRERLHSELEINGCIVPIE